jgi:Zn-finger nucleic acid-binding protein
MNCPLCVDSVLDVTFHGGIELDICPTCRGVWLDRGELDRIAAGTEPVASQADQPARASNHDRPDRDALRGTSRFDDRDDDRRRSKRKKSLGSRLGDIFEEIVDL